MFGNLNPLNQHMQHFAPKVKIEMPESWTKGIEKCNRTACQTGRSVFMYNHSTQAYYCVKCARLINDGNGTINGVPLCAPDEDKRKYEKEFKQKMTWKEYQDTKDMFFQ